MNIVSDPKSIPATSALSPEAAVLAVATGVLTVDLDAICANWRKLEKTAVPAECSAVIKADAGLTAQITMGQADAEATRVYAEAFSRDKDFYAFWRSLEAYKQAFGTGGSTMVLSPDSDFFKYFSSPALPGKK